MQKGDKVQIFKEGVYNEFVADVLEVKEDKVLLRVLNVELGDVAEKWFNKDNLELKNNFTE